MTKSDKQDVVIPMDRESIERLSRMSRDCGKHPRDLAADLLRDLLIDDEQAHAHAHGHRLH